jgi:N-acetylated-alpha-linked acidic dipeptidase
VAAINALEVRVAELEGGGPGKIVLARYGGNFRGYKAKFAQEAGAAGLLIYTDPDDSGYRKGVPYPEGGWASESYIQRGSIITLPYSGDPLTPGIPATKDAKRLDPKDIELPGIPVQPIGYGAAREIMSRMTGTPLPQELVKTWQGGLPFAYRLTGGPELRVRVMVRQERAIRKTANVIATLPGVKHPEQKVIVGCHHDAWGHGAGDPLSGTILVVEAARSFAQAAKHGLRPDRTIIFATWGAEEFGILGSSEYCEQFADDLSQNAVAYINLDAAAMGTQFGASSSPSLKRIIDEIAAHVPQSQATDGATIRSAWLGDREEPNFGNLGGGSDHVGFYCHLGIPSCSLGAGGSPGTAYHSVYDNLHWYRQVVGNDYEPALMLTRIVNLLAARLADDAIVPLDPARYAVDLRVHLADLANRAGELGVSFDATSVSDRINSLDAAASSLGQRLNEIDATRLSHDQRAAINHELLTMERAWLLNEGLPERPWFRSLYASSDPDSGYAAWMLPGLRWAIEQNDPKAIERWLAVYATALDGLLSRLAAIESSLNSTVAESP